MLQGKSLIRVMASTALVAILAGCGTSPSTAPEDFGNTGGYTDPTGVGANPADPYGGNTNPYNPGAGTGIGTNPYGGNTTPTGDMAQLTATVSKKKNGVFLGMGSFKCTVEVTNPGSTSHSGTLTVTFKNGSKTSKTAPVSKHVTLGPNETQSFDFSDSKWSTDSVQVDITTDAAPAAAGGTYGGATGYGYGAATGSTYGATGSYGASNTYGTGANTGYPTGTSY